MGDHIVSLNLVLERLPLCIRQRSPCHFAFASNHSILIILLRVEFFTVFYSHYVAIKLSHVFLFFLLARAVLVGLTVALFKIKLNSCSLIWIVITIKQQALWIIETIQLSKKQVKMTGLNFIWRVKMSFVFPCALVKRYHLSCVTGCTPLLGFYLKSPYMLSI